MTPKSVDDMECGIPMVELRSKGQTDTYPVPSNHTSTSAISNESITHSSSKHSTANIPARSGDSSPALEPDDSNMATDLGGNDHTWHWFLVKLSALSWCGWYLAMFYCISWAYYDYTGTGDHSIKNHVHNPQLVSQVLS